MKKTTLFVLAGLFFLPSIVSAAWWNPFTWHIPFNTKFSVVATSTSDATASTTASSTIDTSLLPSTNDLYKRIAELEQKLDDARANLKTTEAAAEAQIKAANTPVASQGASLPSKDTQSKLRASVVLVDTAFGSGAGSIIDAQGHILTRAQTVGTSTSATITLSSGTKTAAILIGIEDNNDIAVLQLVDKKTSSYTPLNYGTNLTVGDTVYIVGFPTSQTNGSAFVAGTVAQKNSASIVANIDSKALDNGGSMITSKGSLIGIPNPPSCKVLEDLAKCIKYTITANIFPARIPKLLQGMKLYRNKSSWRTPEESLFRGYFDGFYQNIIQSDGVTFAIQNVTGQNSFDYFNDKLNNDPDGKIAKLYVGKLKLGAQYMSQAYDVLKSLSFNLRVSLLNDSALALKLDSYQQAMFVKIRDDNDARIKAYLSKVDYWTKKKNEYDAYTNKSEDVTHDYLMGEGADMETAANALGKERQKILDGLSGDIINVF